MRSNKIDDDDDRETRPYQVPASGDPNEGEGSRSAARLYNQHAAQYASDPDRVRRAALAAERLEGPDGKDGKARRPPRGTPAPDNHSVEVKFDGHHWCVTHTSLDHALEFSNLDDAEHRASELGRDSGDGVVVYDQAGAVLASYSLDHD